MKKLLVLTLALAAVAFTAPTYNKAIKGNIGQSLPLFGTGSAVAPTGNNTTNLDTMEIDTSYYFYDVIDKPIVSNTDTIGFATLTVKDSSGTDSAGARLIWYGNMRSDGKGAWQAIDSVSKLGASASSYINATPTPVINSKGFMAIMFTLGNPLRGAAAQKCTVKDVYVNRRARVYITN